MKQRSTSHAERVAMIDRHLAGETLEQIARSMHLSYYSVRTFWRRYQRHGWPALVPPPLGPNPSGPLGRYHPRIKYVLLRLKKEHRGWGVDKLRLELQRRPSLAGVSIPHRSTLAAYLSQFGERLRRPRRLRTTRPRPTPVQPQAPHQTWQIDFKGDEAVGGIAGRVAPFMVCDTASGAPLAGVMHTIRTRGQRTGIDARTVQTDLRQVFARWGLPESIRMDRDAVFVGSSRLEWPGLVLLWLIGLGVQPIINRVFRPTDNAIVERNHQTWTAHVVIDQVYEDVAALQAATDQAYADRRAHLPSRHAGCDGCPPLRAFPSLAQPRRSYSLEQEAQLFDLARVDAYLAEWRWQRLVDSAGKISLNGRNYRVGKRYTGQVIRVQFDTTVRQCVCSLVDGTEVRRVSVPEFSAEYLLGVSHADLATGGCN
jgi:transposase InsO family protein